MLKKQIILTYDPKTCGVEGGDLFSYLFNELNAHRIEVSMREVPDDEVATTRPLEKP